MGVKTLGQSGAVFFFVATGLYASCFFFPNSVLNTLSQGGDSMARKKPEQNQKKSRAAKKVASKVTKKKSRQRGKTAIKREQTARTLGRIAAITRVAAAAVATITGALKRFGKVETHAHGTTVYATRQLSLNILPEHVRGASKRVDNNCPVARALRDSPLGPWITDAHVGETTVRVWNIAIPDLEVKFLLSAELINAVKAWDRPGGKWELKPGMYWLNVYPRSLRRGYVSKGDRTCTVSGPRVRKSSRHITRLNDIRKAVVLADVQQRTHRRRKAG